MDEPILVTLNDRGQFTVPKKARDTFGAKHFNLYIMEDKIELTPMQTREEFLAELDAAEEEYKREGGYSLEEVGKMLGLTDEDEEV